MKEALLKVSIKNSNIAKLVDEINSENGILYIYNFRALCGRLLSRNISGGQ